MNNDTGLFDVIDINMLIQGSSRNMPTTKKGMLHVNIQQVDGTEWVHTLWPVKFCPKAGANLFSLMSKLQGNKISSDPWNNIVVNSSKGDIILDHQIKTCNSWVDRVEFLLETGEERA